MQYTLMNISVIYCHQAEQEMRQKVELIQQIRAMESVPVVRTKFIDQTETSGQGLLAEMSLVEVWKGL